MHLQTKMNTEVCQKVDILQMRTTFKNYKCADFETYKMSTKHLH